MTCVMWFRRDLRLHDHPALNAAVADGPLVALYVLDDVLRAPSGKPRIAFLYETLRSLDADLKEHGGRLIVRRGKPENVVPAVARDAGATKVHISADFGPYGSARDDRVDEALGDIELVRTGSPYAVAPGRVTKDDGSYYQVYTPFYRAWMQHGWREPARSSISKAEFVSGIAGTDIPAAPKLPADIQLPDPGEAAARTAWQRFRKDGLADYADARNRPDLDATSRMSVYLKWGAIHPRTMLADLEAKDDTYRKELAWREFYATVLHFRPESAREYYLPAMAKMTYSSGAAADDHLQAWKAGKTGYPIVDAGMRQLMAEGWMHNRVRMIVASFLVKDLHLEWTVGARHFMEHLVDGDLASNQHGWQWTAGTGTDASPYYRVFNPTSQGVKFDPRGDYVRRWIPELRELEGADAHEPAAHGGATGYPDPIVDHKKEREVALERYQAARNR